MPQKKGATKKKMAPEVEDQEKNVIFEKYTHSPLTFYLTIPHQNMRK